MLEKKKDLALDTPKRVHGLYRGIKHTLLFVQVLRAEMAMPIDSVLDPGNRVPPLEGESHALMHACVRCAPFVAR